jgi:hypothetical protein
MGSFQRAFLGYRRPEVDAEIQARDFLIGELNREVDELNAELFAKAELETELTSLSGMVLEREREIRCLNERLRESNACHDRSIASLDAITSRLEEVEAQARGQATRIRMKALREAVEVSKKVKELTEMEPALRADAQAAEASAAADDGLYEGEVKLEIGPLGDFSQLVGFEDAVGQIGASEIKVDRFSEGRATFSMQLDEPTDLLSELEELSSLDLTLNLPPARGCSSAGRALRWQRRGQGFEPPQLH